MIKRTIKQYTPNYKVLDTPIEQARAIQDLYDQVRIFYDYLNDPNFDISHTGKPGPPGPPGDKGDPGMSSFEVWKTIPGNEHKTIEDYINSIVHEAEHVKQAMLKAYKVDDSGEPPAYTIGFIVMKMLVLNLMNGRNHKNH